MKQDGFISLDFLFSITIAGFLCMVLFAMTFTFTVVEVSQYIAFSVSRAHMAGHVDQEKQELMAKNKFTVMVNNPIFAPLYKNGWFELTGPDIRGGGEGGKTFAAEYPVENESKVAQVGVRLLFNAKLLSMNFSFLGSTASDDRGFLAHITGLLIREPTTRECQKALSRDVRYKTLLDLDAGRFSIANGYADKYVAMEDNGC